MNLRPAVLSLLFGVALAAGCATTDLAPHTGTRLALEDDEKRLWIQAEEGERQLARSGLVERDPELETYLAGILRTLFPNLSLACRVRLLRDGAANAFALPNGAIYVHTGLLARMENEAQLAALLGHEGAHAGFRHSLRSHRQAVNRSALYTAVTLGGWGGSLFTVASVTGYHRDLEREADTEGYRRMVAAGYDASEAPKLFRILEQWIAQTGATEPYFFLTHPRLRERIENYEGMIASDTGRLPGALHRDRFLAKVRDVVIETAWLDLKGGRFDGALQGAGRYLAIGGPAAAPHYLRGEAYRQRGSDGDADRARAEYLAAIAADPSYPEPYRALGLLHFKNAEREEARRYLEKYLSLAPRALDRAYMEGYLGRSR